MSQPQPVPVGLRTGLEHDLIDELPPNGDIRWKVRRAIEGAYALGYRDGHLAGSEEMRYDLRAEQQAADVTP